MASATDQRRRLWLSRMTFVTPLLWLATALVASILIPLLDRHAHFDLGVSEAAATTMLSAEATGMIAFTGLVFSISILVIQFGTQALSPRVIPELRRDRLTGHALGVFIATFIFSLGAVVDIGSDHGEAVPSFSVLTAGALLIGSVVMFLLLIQRVGTGLQLPRVLVRIGQLGVDAADATYPDPYEPGCDDKHRYDLLPANAAEIKHPGHTAVIAAVDIAALQAESARTGALIELVPAMGRRIFPGEVLLRYSGGSASEEALVDAVILAPARTILQDPAYALRLIVDIAIRALSPAVNDPTSAMQALNEIQLILGTVAHRTLALGGPTVHIRASPWEDMVELALSEISLYGASSVQIPRRMRALLDELEYSVPAERRAALIVERIRLESLVRVAHGPEPDPMLLVSDPYGVGMARADPPRRRSAP